MGFKVPRKTARLVFEGEEFEGCEIVVALDITFEAQLHMQELRGSDDEDAGPDAQRAILTLFAESALVSWNLEDDGGKPIDVTTEAFLQLPGWFGMLVLNGWGDAIKTASEVSAPLDKPSKNGSSSEEQSETMAAASSALPS